MYLPVIALMQHQHGLVTSRQLCDAGLCPNDVRRLLASGVLVRLRRGVYADADAWHALEPYRAQPLLRIRAADMTLTSDARLYSHDSAAIALAWERPTHAPRSCT